MDPGQLTYLAVFAVTSGLLAWLAARSARDQAANATREFLAILLVTTAWATTITVQLALADVRAVQVAGLYASNVVNHLLWLATMAFAFAFTNDRDRLRHPAVLALAREGQVISDTEPVPLADVAQDAWASVHAPDATLTILDAPTIEADPGRLCTVLENLFRNATEHGGDTVTITVDALPDAAGFRVTDDGPGIPDADKRSVRDHGYTTRADGTGLGLSIVDRIVDAHGWTLTIRDSPSGGAAFEFRTDD